MAFSFIQITDHHLRELEATLTRGYSTWHAFRAVMRHIAQHHSDVDFIVTTGDIVDTGTDAEYQAVRRALGIIETSVPPGPQRVTIEGLRDMPMYFLPGNHDPRDAFFRNMFSQSPPAPAMNVTFTHKGVQFVCLDWGAENKSIATPTLFPQLAQAVQSDAPTILLTHHHVAPTGMSYLDNYLSDEIDEFARIIAGRRVLAILSGHVHITYESQVGSVPVYGLRSTMFSFTQCGDKLFFVLGNLNYRAVTVEDGKISTEIVEVPL
jgi:3',5'-cyclic-AMP phosphodiesterase